MKRKEKKRERENFSPNDAFNHSLDFPQLTYVYSERKKRWFMSRYYFVILSLSSDTHRCMSLLKVIFAFFSLFLSLRFFLASTTRNILTILFSHNVCMRVLCV